MSGAGGTADFFYREAQRLGYVARSAFKLIQIQKQHKLIAPGAAVLDLGCAPGAWLQVACQNLGPLEKGGVIVGVDVKKVKVPSAHCDSRVRTVCADVMALMKQQARAMSPQERGFSVILSDMCPVVSGITTKDAAISCELGMRALSLAVGKMKAKDSDCIAILEKFQSSTEPDPDEDGILRRGGSLVIKFLENEDIPGFGKFCKEKFKKVSLLRPKATRSSSREIFMVCEGRGFSVAPRWHPLSHGPATYGTGSTCHAAAHSLVELRTVGLQREAPKCSDLKAQAQPAAFVRIPRGASLPATRNAAGLHSTLLVASLLHITTHRGGTHFYISLSVGWETPRREECRIPVVPPQCPAPPRKRPVALPELGKERREPPKGGYFQPPDLESLFVLAPPRRQASSCA
uniref:rRNA methyltransferase 2, mitochondrial n=1 Tax=Oryza sativa subsp. japonica TaxID=39947 RepID=Q852A4_ORYSJ|nr:putative FtsJ cell division protein [Oryza sativa Japonica Group]